MDEATKGASSMDTNELRHRWAKAWGIAPCPFIGRAMLQKSLAYKLYENTISAEGMKRAAQLVAAYKRDDQTFCKKAVLKYGTELIRSYEGKKHVVRVIEGGFEYGGHHYKSLSKIANDITGSKWNGWVFFGVKKVQK